MWQRGDPVHSRSWEQTGQRQSVYCPFSGTQKSSESFCGPKMDKGSSPIEKAVFVERTDKGFAIQPNFTQKRAQLFGQLKDAYHRYNWEACWADYKTRNSFLKNGPKWQTSTHYSYVTGVTLSIFKNILAITLILKILFFVKKSFLKFLLFQILCLLKVKIHLFSDVVNPRCKNKRV